MHIDHWGRRAPSGAVAIAVLALSLLASPARVVAQTPQNAGENDITKRVQQETAINLPSLHPLVKRILPAVVNISSELAENSGPSNPSGNAGDAGNVNQGGTIRRELW